MSTLQPHPCPLHGDYRMFSDPPPRVCPKCYPEFEGKPAPRLQSVSCIDNRYHCMLCKEELDGPMGIADHRCGKKPNREAIDAGFEFEKDFAKLIGGEVHPGSGNKWYARLDVGSGSVVFSAKSTEKKTFTLTPAMFKEVDEEISGPAGRGGIGAFAIRLENDPSKVYVTLRVEDLLRMLQEGIHLGRESRGEAVRRQASVPELLRDDDNE